MKRQFEEDEILRPGDDLSTLKPGHTRSINGKLFGRCVDCDRIIRVDGWLGGLHICA